jgi:glycyl-tRNA synthetase
MLKDISTLVAVSKRRGFVFQSSELYGGLSACYDYGPMGVLIKNNLRSLWWRSLVSRPDIEGLDTSILMSSKVWEASGHVENFTDPLVDCRECKSRFRQDEVSDVCPNCGSKNLTQPRAFNLMFKTHMGPVEDEGSLIYLRPETAQGIYVNFLNVMQTTRKKLPFGIAQIGKAFRNEITARNFIFRMREFEQMEMQYFVAPQDPTDWFEYWLTQRLAWYEQSLHLKAWIQPVETPKNSLAHYARRAVDIKFQFPFGLEEIEGIHHRGDYDLGRHGEFSRKDLSVFDEQTKQRFVPWVIETSVGLDRLFLATLTACFREDELDGEKRTYFAFPYEIAPYHVGIYPLMKKDGLAETAEALFRKLHQEGVWVFSDHSGSIGKRYRRADEIGVPLGITIDYQTLQDQTVTVRDRDSAKQIRVAANELNPSRLKQIDSGFRAG